MVKKYYLAYGSNLNIRQMLGRCRQARIVGVSEIPNYELLFKGSRTGSYLTIEPSKNSNVPVGVWSITEEDEMSLDRYEGFPTLYYKKKFKLPVELIESGETKNLDTFVYIMHESRPIGIPSRYYVETCLEGYRNFRLNQKFLLKALSHARRYCYEGK